MKEHYFTDATHFPSIRTDGYVNLREMSKKFLIGELMALKNEFRTLWLIHMELRHNRKDTEGEGQASLYRFLAGR